MASYIAEKKKDDLTELINSLDTNEPDDMKTGKMRTIEAELIEDDRTVREDDENTIDEKETC